MSTVLEAIAARDAGLDVLAISLVTNRAAGLGGRLDHGEVLATAAASVERMRALLEALLPQL
jgi:purine-nucleoside phosphorylase